MGTREVITLQCGSYANYVGAHFWNIQNEDLIYEPREVLPSTDPNVLYREGLSLKSEVTYTPRLISVDLKGSLGALPRYGELYQLDEKEENIGLWAGEVSERRDLTVDKEKETEVESWTNYLNPFLHPKSNVVIEKYKKDDTLKPFDVFGLGRRVDENQEEEFFDSIRFFSEETDGLQGFHFLADADSAFGGLASRINQYLMDEYSKKSVLAFPVWPSLYDYKSESNNALLNHTRFLNIVLTLSALSEESLTTPMSLNPDYYPLPKRPAEIPGLNINHESLCHTSSILASSLDTLSLPWRLKTDTYVRIGDFSDVLSRAGRSISALSTSIPCFFKEEDLNFFSLSPRVPSNGLKIRSQSIVARGRVPLSFNLEEYASNQFSRTFNVCKVIRDEGISVSKPYPSIFDNSYNRVSSMTRWKSTDETGEAILEIAERAEKINLNKLHRFIESDLESDELTEVINSLKNLSENYKGIG